ncbi:hypothetical protein EHR08_17115 [Leptospira bandrabouensis]|uniref:Uncharacterized protein n=1 Tax=Leptospira bandrabouensis TaxID=2484903 RepID=A0A6H3NSR1_9LEPT|nr:hypothetical protein EHR08_17115 [Leptospira bandrabouensis]
MLHLNRTCFKTYKSGKNCCEYVV